MRITVRLFAMQREQVGAKVVALELAETTLVVVTAFETTWV